MKEKYKIFENGKLTTMVIEIDITKNDKNFKQLLDLIQQFECVELSDNDLEVKDIYFK
jgi:hypothetical protein